MLTERDEAVAASRRAEQRQALLVRELHHRVRNALATVQALLGASARSSGRLMSCTALSQRASLAKTQTLLTEDYWQTAPFRAILEQELQPFMGADEGRFVLKKPPVELAADLAVPVGMAVHELARNARMHGALSVATGWIAVKWEVRQAEGSRTFRLEWAEHDGPPISKPLRSGFGLTLLERALPMQAKAKTKLSFNPNGLRFEMEAPWVEQRLVQNTEPPISRPCSIVPFRFISRSGPYAKARSHQHAHLAGGSIH